MLVLLMEGVYELQHSDGLGCSHKPTLFFRNKESKLYMILSLIF
jgi:hypothetical protein